MACNLLQRKKSQVETNIYQFKFTGNGFFIRAEMSGKQNTCHYFEMSSNQNMQIFQFLSI